jgi:hypothetical protein
MRYLLPLLAVGCGQAASLPSDVVRVARIRPLREGVEARKKAITHTIDVIQSEPLDGEPLDIRARIALLPPARYRSGYESQFQFAALSPVDDFPLLDVQARDHTRYLAQPSDLNRVMSRKDIVTASQWLQDRQIDLILVLCPPVHELYSEHFFKNAPDIIAPHMRKAILDLLENDVEVVDGFSLFRPHRKPDPDYTHFARDSHWAPRGRRIAAKEIASRLKRYSFNREAAPVVNVGPLLSQPEGEGNGDEVLTGEQLERTKRAPPVLERTVTMPDGGNIHSDPVSPVYLIGSSFADNFDRDLVAETNIIPRFGAAGNQTTESFCDFVREPERLDGVRVVLWVLGEWQLAYLQPLPPSIVSETARRSSR